MSVYLVRRRRRSVASAGATAPAQFQSGNWSVSDLGTSGDIRIAITALPSDGGSSITDLEYRLDAGSWTSLASTTTGNYDIAGLTDGTTYAVAIRAVNAVGNGTASATKNVTPTGVPDAFVDANWSVATGSSSTELDITIASLPAANGASITDVQYDVDASGSWTSLPAYAGTGTYTVTMATYGVSYSIRLRAVNATGNGTAGNAEAAVSGDDYFVNSVSPELVADFPNTYYRKSSADSAFSGLFTFARGSTATYVDSSGILQTATSGTARTAHHVWNGTSYVNEGLLIEATGSENLLKYYNDATDAIWSTAGLQAVTGTSPFDLLEDGTDSQHGLQQANVVTSGDEVCMWAVVEAGTRNYARINPFGPTISNALNYAEFDLVNGTVTSSGANNVRQGIKEVGDGIWLIYMVCEAATANGSITFRVGPSSDGLQGPNTYVGSAGDGIKFYYGQMEVQPLPTSVIPTTNSTVTRAAETLTIAAADLPYSSTAMSIAMEGTMTYRDEDVINTVKFIDWPADADNKIVWRLDTNSTRTGEPRLLQDYATAISYTDSPAPNYSPGMNVPFSLAGRHGASFINLAKDGTALTVNTAPTALPDLSATDMDVASTFMGTIKRFRMWGADIGDTGIEEATA